MDYDPSMITFHFNPLGSKDFVEIFTIEDLSFTPSIGSRITHQTIRGIEYDSWPRWKVVDIVTEYWGVPPVGSVTINVQVIPMGDDAKSEVEFLIASTQ